MCGWDRGPSGACECVAGTVALVVRASVWLGRWP